MDCLDRVDCRVGSVWKSINSSNPKRHRLELLYHIILYLKLLTFASSLKKNTTVCYRAKGLFAQLNEVSATLTAFVLIIVSQSCDLPQTKHNFSVFYLLCLY